MRGASRPFNFFQNSNTGYLQAGGTGIVSPVIYGLFSGFFTPASIIVEGGNRTVNIESDFVFWPTTFSIGVQGDQSSANRDNTNLSISIQGDYIPAIRDSGFAIGINISGNVSGCNYDKPLYIVNFTGQHLSSPKDSTNYNVILTGDFLQAISDRPNFKLGISGNMTSGNTDRPKIFVSLSGNFLKTNKDFAATNLTLIQGGWGAGNQFQSFSIGPDIGFSNLKIIQGIWGA